MVIVHTDIVQKWRSSYTTWKSTWPFVQKRTPPAASCSLNALMGLGQTSRPYRARCCCTRWLEEFHTDV